MIADWMEKFTGESLIRKRKSTKWVNVLSCGV